MVKLLSNYLMNRELAKDFKQFEAQIKQVPLHIRPVFMTALKGAWKLGFISGYKKYGRKTKVIHHE